MVPPGMRASEKDEFLKVKVNHLACWEPPTYLNFCWFIITASRGVSTASWMTDNGKTGAEMLPWMGVGRLEIRTRGEIDDCTLALFM